MNAEEFGGIPFIGAVFGSENGQPTNHFATAWVVASMHGNVIVSAAHILIGRNAADLMFAPGYANGHAPHGWYHMHSSATTAAWQQDQNINDDFCLMKVGEDLQSALGSLNLLVDEGPQACDVIGYPDGQASPVHATVQARWFMPGQQFVMDCGGYPNGTSGAPWVAENGAFGLIGGYQQGGDSPSISYSPCFGAAISDLYSSYTATC